MLTKVKLWVRISDDRLTNESQPGCHEALCSRWDNCTQCHSAQWTLLNFCTLFLWAVNLKFLYSFLGVQTLTLRYQWWVLPSVILLCARVISDVSVGLYPYFAIISTKKIDNRTSGVKQNKQNTSSLWADIKLLHVWIHTCLCAYKLHITTEQFFI